MKMNDNMKVPEGWKRVRLGEVVTENSKSPFKVEEADNEGRYPFFTSGEEILKHSKFLIDDENIFISTGGTAYVKYYNGKSSYSADTYSLKSKINTLYLYHFIYRKLNHITLRYFIGSGLEHLQKQDFKNSFEVIFPIDPNEQQKIAEILETVDRAIEKTDKIIEKYKRIKQGLMHDLLKKGIDENGKIRSEKTHKFKNSPLGRIPEEWEVVRLGEVIEIFDNKRIPLDGEYRSTIKGDIPYCGATGVIDFINDFIFDGEYVLIAEDGGKFQQFEKTAYIMNVKFWANNHVHIVRGKSNLCNLFMMYFINFKDISYYISGSTREKLNQQLLKSIPIPLPPLPEQQRIAEILSQIDNTIEKEEAYKQKLDRIKKGLMEDLLTGRVRVNELIKEE